MQGFQGCTSTKHELQGKLTLFSTKEALLTHTFTDPTNALIPVALWCKLSTGELHSLSHTHITALTVITIDLEQSYSKCENKLQASLIFPVIRIQTVEESKLLLEQATMQQQQYYSSFAFYMGNANVMNSSTCLGMGKCDPLGGLSVWGTVHNPPLQRGEEMIMLTANLDSKAFFHDLSFGFVQSAGDVAIALAVAKALSTLPKTTARIGIALFQGEAMGRIGSKRFLHDIGVVGQCEKYSSSKNETCLAPPNYMLEWTKFEGNVSRIKTVVALQRLLTSGSSTLLVHGTGGGDTGNVLQSKLLQQLNRSSLAAATSGQVPMDSTLRTFMENPTWNSSVGGGGLSLRAVNDDADGDDYLGEDEMPQTVDLDRAQAMGTALARTLYSLATNDNEEQDIQVDRDYLEHILLCLGAQDGYLYTNCTLALDLLNVTSAQMLRKIQANGLSASNGFASNPLPAFTSVYRPSRIVTNNVKLREHLARNFLADACFERNEEEPVFLCKTDVNCRDAWVNATCEGLASNSSKICLAGRCVCSSVTYHDSYSTALMFDASKGRYIIQNEEEMLWTEPIWNSQQGYTTFAVSNTESVATSLTVGIAISLISLCLIRRAQHTEKFKLT